MDTTEQVDALKRTSIDVDRQLKAIGRVLDLTNGNLTLAGTVTAAAFVGSGAISGASLTVTGAISCGSLVCSTGSVDIYVGSAASEDHALRFKNAAGTTVAMLEGYDANLAQGFILETKYMDGRDHWAEVIANAASTYVADVGLYAKSGSSTASLVLQCDSDGTVIATADLTARLTVSVSDAVTNTVLPALRLYRSVSGGVGADGVGVELDFYTEDSAGTYEKIANIDAVNSTALHASQVSELRFTVLGTLVLTLSSANVISSSGRLVLSDTASSQTLLIGGTAFVVDGKNKLVAIGTATTTTGVQLDIQSTDVVLRLTNTGSGGAYLGLRNGGSNSGHYWTFELGGDQVLWKRDGADIFVMTSSTWYFKVPLVYNNVNSAALRFGATGTSSTMVLLASNIEAIQISSTGGVTVPVSLASSGNLTVASGSSADVYKLQVMHSSSVMGDLTGYLEVGGLGYRKVTFTAGISSSNIAGQLYLRAYGRTLGVIAAQLNVDADSGYVNVATGSFVVDTNTLFVDAANDLVGIGTSSFFTGAKLQVNTTSAAWGIYTVCTAAESSTSGGFFRAYGGFVPSAADKRLGGLFMGAYSAVTPTDNVSASIETFSSEAWSGSTAGAYMVFKTCAGGGALGRTERMRLTAAGYLGIGTTAPASGLELSADTPTPGSASFTVASSSSAWNTPYLVTRRARGTVASKSDVTTGDVLGGLAFQGWRGGGVSIWRTAAQIVVKAVGTWSDSSNPGDLYIYTTGNGATGSTARAVFTYAGSAVLQVNGALATNATDGFTYIPTCAGTPTGVPATYTGAVAMVYDTTNNKLYIYNGGWKAATHA